MKNFGALVVAVALCLASISYSIDAWQRHDEATATNTLITNYHNQNVTQQKAQAKASKAFPGILAQAESAIAARDTKSIRAAVNDAVRQVEQKLATGQRIP